MLEDYFPFERAPEGGVAPEAEHDYFLVGKIAFQGRAVELPGSKNLHC